MVIEIGVWISIFSFFLSFASFFFPLNGKGKKRPVKEGAIAQRKAYGHSVLLTRLWFECFCVHCAALAVLGKETQWNAYVMDEWLTACLSFSFFHVVKQKRIELGLLIQLGWWPCTYTWYTYLYYFACVCWCVYVSI